MGKSIIMFPGSIESPFFEKEIRYMKKYFDNIYIISYWCKKSICQEIEKKYNISIYRLSKYNWKGIININLIRWLFEKNTGIEIKEKCIGDKKKIYGFLYILLYGIFYSEVKDIIDKILDEQSDVILYSFWLTRGAYAIAHYSKERKVEKIISRVHGYDLYEERNKINYLPFRKYIIKNLDEIDFISEIGKKYFEDKYKTDHLKTKVFYLGVDNNHLKKEIKVKNTICIASCSSIIPVKRLDLIIESIKEINLPIQWIHIGDGKEREKIEGLAKVKLRSKLYEFKGQLENKKVQKCLIENDVDYFINLSDSEGIPVSIMEALSIGIPIIARNVGGNSEIISDKVGLLLQGDDINEWIKKMENFCNERLNSIEEYSLRSQNCINLWQQKFNETLTYEKFFKKLIL